VGVVFLDVKQCKKAITQHAIIHDHAFRPIRSYHNKFRVCAREHIRVVSGGFMLLPVRTNTYGAR
jgi:hypothetical protein